MVTLWHATENPGLWGWAGLDPAQGSVSRNLCGTAPSAGRQAQGQRSCHNRNLQQWVVLGIIAPRSIQFSHLVVSNSLRSHGLQHTRPPCPCHQLPEFTPTHVHQVGDAIQPSHPLSAPFPPAFYLSQHEGLFQWVSSLHQMAKVLEFQLPSSSVFALLFLI